MFKAESEGTEMRYAFGSPEVSLVNRVVNAINRITTDNDNFVYDPIGTSALCAAMWFEADKSADWNAESDVVSNTYPLTDKLYQYAMDFYPVVTDEYERAIKTWDECAGLAATFENRLWLACVVAGCWQTLHDGLVCDVWSEDNLARIEAEFKADRKQVADAIEEMVYSFAGINPSIKVVTKDA